MLFSFGLFCFICVCLRVCVLVVLLGTCFGFGLIDLLVFVICVFWVFGYLWACCLWLDIDSIVCCGLF